MIIALTRDVSSNINGVELTHFKRREIDVAAARSQHEQYEACLRGLGCEVIRIPGDPDLPDSVFIEDTAIALDELAIISRPGAASRRPEIRGVAEALEPYRSIYKICSPGTLDGGDVLRIGGILYVGLSGRTNQAGIEQLSGWVSVHGYRVKTVSVEGCLHLKSAVTLLPEDTLLINRDWIDPLVFGNSKYVEVDPSEPYAANALLVNETAIYPDSFPKTLKRLKNRGIAVEVVDVSELQKAEGGVTCCSVIFQVSR